MTTFSLTARAYDVVDVKGGGAVEGKVTFDGQLPAPQKIPVVKDEKACGAGSRTVGDVTLSKNGGVVGAVVFIQDVKSGKAWPAAPAEGFVIDQTGCQFKASAFVMRKGSSVRVKNGDPVFHNVHLYEVADGKKSDVFNVGMVPRMQLSRDLATEKSPFVKMECDVHNFMHDWIFVAETPYYAVTSAEGTFKIDQIPAGTYHAIAWHPSLGTQDVSVTVKAGSSTVDFHLKK
jgi:hypothetical protein